MNLYKKTGCRILLVCYLKTVPEIKMDQEGEFTATIMLIRKKATQDKLGRLMSDEILSYRVFVSGQSALRIKQFGFPGLYLWVEGDLQNASDIVAEKISFLDFPEPNENNKMSSFESIIDLCDDKNFNLSFISDGRDELSAPYLIH